MVRSYDELILKGVAPQEASRQAAELGRKVNVCGIAMPSGIGLTELDRFDQAKIKAKIGELHQQVLGMTPEEQNANLDIRDKLNTLGRMDTALQYWNVTAPTRTGQSLEEQKQVLQAQDDAKAQEKANAATVFQIQQQRQAQSQPGYVAPTKPKRR